MPGRYEDALAAFLTGIPDHLPGVWVLGSPPEQETIMPGNTSRNKGHNFERLVARRMREKFSQAARRPQGRGALDGCDVEGTPFWVECKRHKRVNLAKGFEQAQKDSVDTGDYRVPVLVAKSDGENTVVVMRFEDWLEWIPGDR